MTYRNEWQAARVALVTAGFSDERISRILVEEPKETSDPVTDVPRHDFEALHEFQKLMWKKLMANQHKGGWSNLTIRFLLERLKTEIEELEENLDAISSHNEPLEQVLVGGENQEVRDMLRRVTLTRCERLREESSLECADIANFAMFIADNLGQLHYKRRG